jgi:hypothetical protein
MSALVTTNTEQTLCKQYLFDKKGLRKFKGYWSPFSLGAFIYWRFTIYFQVLLEQSAFRLITNNFNKKLR